MTMATSDPEYDKAVKDYCEMRHDELTQADIVGCIGSDHDEASRLKNQLARQLIASFAHCRELLEALEGIIAEAIEHWPDAENWECIENAQTLVAKVRGHSHAK